MLASVIASSSPGLLDLTYGGDHSPSGVLDARMPAKTVQMILAMEPRVRASFPSNGQKTDCRYASSAWMRAFRAVGIAADVAGGDGVDEDAFTSDWKLVPPEARSGYREDDGQVHRHYWLLLTPDLLLFDPTAHQFDTRAGVSLERYIVDGEPIVSSPPSGRGRP